MTANDMPSPDLHRAIESLELLRQDMSLLPQTAQFAQRLDQELRNLRAACDAAGCSCAATATIPNTSAARFSNAALVQCRAKLCDFLNMGIEIHAGFRTAVECLWEKLQVPQKPEDQLQRQNRRTSFSGRGSELQELQNAVVAALRQDLNDVTHIALSAAATTTASSAAAVGEGRPKSATRFRQLQEKARLQQRTMSPSSSPVQLDAIKILQKQRQREAERNATPSLVVRSIPGALTSKVARSPLVMTDLRPSSAIGTSATHSQQIYHAPTSKISISNNRDRFVHALLRVEGLLCGK